MNVRKAHTNGSVGGPLRLCGTITTAGVTDVIVGATMPQFDREDEKLLDQE